ncbi:MAG: GNAT family N-acetyltransferase [Pseudomonadota bacterium]
MSPARLYAAIEATWPAASITRLGPWAIRDGQGGGKRVSAASAEDTFGAGDIAAAEDAMRALGQRPLFWIRQGDGRVNTALALRGYDRIDPVLLYAAPVGRLAHLPPPVSAFLMEAPLAIMEEIWAEGGIGPARLAVMTRASEPKVMALGRVADRPAGVGFAAMFGDIAMVHALETRTALRRKGAGRYMMQALAVWAEEQGAQHVALAVTHGNTAARHLYQSLGMEIAGRYHYRIKKG